MQPCRSWDHLNRLQLGRYAEYFAKMQFVLHGFDVYSPEVDDRGIDFVLRRDGRYWDVQVKSSRGNNIFFPEDKFRIRSNLLAVVARFKEGCLPDLFLIQSTNWNAPNKVLVYRDYEGKKSAPEYGINFSKEGDVWLEQFRFAGTLPSIFDADAVAEARP